MPYAKLKRIKSPTGKVHYAYLDFIDKEGVKIYQPYCNHRTWIGDYWGKKWVSTDESITCGNCLSAIKSMKLLPLDEELTNLGEEMRQSKTAQYKKFLELSKICKFRKTTCYYRSALVKHYAFKCTNPGLDDPHFGWRCSPSNCPHIGHLSGSEWAYDIEEKPNKKEIADYEDSRSVKED